tara:strand:- start:463 stop:747 length:285 start_codon:yes stop_codon:yes gene_type:complete
MSKIKEYYVDFSCMIVNAESSKQAEDIALDFLKENGLSPQICNIEESGDKEPDEVGIHAEDTFHVTKTISFHRVWNRRGSDHVNKSEQDLLNEV